MSKYTPVPVMSEGQELTLDKINSIITMANERRVLVHASTENAIAGSYSTNDATSQIRIEARSVVVNTSSSNWGEAIVRFAGAFSQPPIVVASWGDNSGVQGGRIPLMMEPAYISKTQFSAFGGLTSSTNAKVRVRINYIAIGPVSVT